MTPGALGPALNVSAVASAAIPAPRQAHFARGAAPPLLDIGTVRALQKAVRAALRLRAGLDARWSWAGERELEFLRAVRGHHVSGILAPYCAALGLPSRVADGIGTNADRVGLESLAHAGRIRQIHDQLTTEGIPVLFFKGLAVEAQTGRPLGGRGGGDVDILIPVERLEPAIAALDPMWRVADGYPKPGLSWAWRHWRRWGSELPLSGPVTVDLHWKLRGVPSDLPDFPVVWAARTEVDIGGRSVPTLGLAHAVAHACRHAEHDRWRILRSLVDIHLLLGQLGPGQLDGAYGFHPVRRAIRIVNRTIGLPAGWCAPSLSNRDWAAVLDEQRHLGTHGNRNSQLARPAQLWRMLGRASFSSRRPGHDAIRLLQVIVMPPPHQLGAIATTAAPKGALQAMTHRFAYERDRRLSR